DSWTALQEAIEAATEVMNDENALESDVTEALNNLTEAIGNLILRADKTRLQTQYDKLDSLDKSVYTEASVAKLVEPMANAKAVLDDPDATQEAVDNAYAELIRAELSLRLIPNKNLLQDLINKANGLNATNYSAKTWNVMQDALEEAKAVLDDPEASQAEVDNAKEVLAKAIAGLETSNSVKAGDTTASVATGDTINMLYPLAGLAAASIVFYGSKKKKEKKD
ncbi:LPXTG cell wall anchor domain-containing protein, partial [Thomasclavelia saccharogumia]|uniref:LPXTG cell wall anchor domain-containing protein n=1 Tax=Thomasclavelia saccharogumia TaxID=341225 RepID=UPI00055340C4